MPEIEIGMAKSGRRAYGLDDIALVPSRRTRDPEDVDLSWEIDAFHFDLPVMAAAMDSVVSPTTAVTIGELGGVGVLALEGLWTRYDDPEPHLAEIAELGAGPEANIRLQELYAEPIRPELIRDRIKEIRGAGVVSCAAITPQRLPAFADTLLAAELDLLVVQGSVVSAEHVAREGDPLNLKTFVRRFDIPVIVGGCASYQAATHLMRTGAAGILVGVGSGATSTTRSVLGIGAAQATAIADARAARMRHLDETGVYVHLIADGGIRTGGDIAKAIACGADAVMVGAPLAAGSDAPGRGAHWGLNGGHADLPRSEVVTVETAGTIAEILTGPAHRSDGRTNLAGALRRSMATCGYPTLKELQKAELTVTPGIRMTDTLPNVSDPAGPILVVDFGAQYAQLIARRVREAHVYSEIVSHTITAAEVAARRPAGVIFSGGPKSVHVEGAPVVDPGIYDLGVPVLGICYGAQLVAQQLDGGVVANTGTGEYGRTELTITHRGVLFGPAQPDIQPVWMSHFDSISEAPHGFTVTASTAGAAVAAMEDVERRIHAVQFHPEVVHSPHGQAVLEHFLYDVCGCTPSWTMGSVIDAQIALVREQVGKARVICALSGGVDSAVAAALVHKAIGSQLTCVFVDTGLMRLGEGEQVVETFQRHQGIELIHVRAADRYFEKLEGVTDPEDKRKAIGELFIRIFEDVSGGIEDAKFLVQGTLYPDVIESGTASAAKIKSHHNVGGLPEDMQFDLVEPLRNLFKDEVRKVGTELGLPDEIVWRQPFPGPGLGVRIIGEVTPDKVAILQKADAVVREEIRSAGLEREIWQAFAVLPDIRTVGVMGDERTYGYPVIIRAVTSEDAMTADWARLPYDLLERMSSRIINEVEGVNRVAYDVTSKPPGTIEWE